MVNFSYEEQTDMVQIFYECKKNSRHSVAAYREQYPDRRKPSHMTFKSILWTDESKFMTNGILNRHNAHYWTDENPHWMRESKFQTFHGVNVWCGIIGDQLIGPYFYSGTLTAQKYLEFLQNTLPILLENVLLATRQHLYFQQDGCPAHNAYLIRHYLNEMFPGKWIGTHSSIPWPLRSPDLTCLDYFLWGYLKNKVYLTSPRDIMELKERIITECKNIPPEVIKEA
ncbi:uncharacterized protein LOC100570008, partial [Acyrthosiphon pisum]|uniref:DUF4817 domain-containing protein n=1 Tax=Acyrthosiphon pisum TaxID=7029 RepID=A0A8R2F7D2_ACYPI